MSRVLYYWTYSCALISLTCLVWFTLSLADPFGISDLSRSPIVMLLNSLMSAVAWPSNLRDWSIYSCFFFNLATTSSRFSFALSIRFYSEMFGAIELNGALQNGHFFFTFAYLLMHSLQYVCPHGNNMNGWLFGGRKSSKQIGQVFDMTWSCSVSSISSPLCLFWALRLDFFLSEWYLFSMSARSFCSSLSYILSHILSIISVCDCRLYCPYYFIFIC